VAGNQMRAASYGLYGKRVDKDMTILVLEMGVEHHVLPIAI
jgi:hypothetical protein